MNGLVSDFACLVDNTYYRLQKICIEFIPPYASATSVQMLEKGMFHSEFGIRTDCPFFSRYRIQRGKAMNIARLMANSEAVVADRIVFKSALIILRNVSFEIYQLPKSFNALTQRHMTITPTHSLQSLLQPNQPLSTTSFPTLSGSGLPPHSLSSAA
jgi:predicted transcriptional regulator